MHGRATELRDGSDAVDRPNTERFSLIFRQEWGEANHVHLKGLKLRYHYRTSDRPTADHTDGLALEPSGF